MMKVSEREPRPARDGMVQVRLASDGMTAYLVLQPPEPGGRPITVDQAHFELNRAGVVFGVDPAAAVAAVEQVGASGEPLTVRVAGGLLPVPGEDARIAYNPLLLEQGGRPRETGDGGVDLFDLGLVRNVPEGTVLATKQPVRPGTPGTDVLGKPVPPPAPRDLPLRAGKGTRRSDDGLQIAAAADGHASLAHGEVRVSDVYVVCQDVGTATGHVEFVGTVAVRGNVHPGFRVRAGQDVRIDGGVEGGTVEAGGSVAIRYGVQGGRGRIQAAGDLRCMFVQSAEIQTGGDITAQDGILHCRVQAGGRVTVLGRRGSIVGGSLRAGGHVRARILGATAGTPTEVAVGVDPAVRQELDALGQEVAAAERKLGLTRQALHLLRQQEAAGQLTADRQAMLTRLVREEFQLLAGLAAAQARREELQAILAAPPVAWIEAETCFPGVRVYIGSASYQVTDTLRRVRFTLNEHREVTF